MKTVASAREHDNFEHIAQVAAFQAYSSNIHPNIGPWTSHSKFDQ